MTNSSPDADAAVSAPVEVESESPPEPTAVPPEATSTATQQASQVSEESAAAEAAAPTLEETHVSQSEEAHQAPPEEPQSSVPETSPEKPNEDSISSTILASSVISAPPVAITSTTAVAPSTGLTTCAEYMSPLVAARNTAAAAALSGLMNPISPSPFPSPLGPSTPAVDIKLFVGRIPASMEEDQLRPLFEKFGPVSELSIIRDQTTGQHKGSAFVRMGSLTQADAAIRTLDSIRMLDPSLGAMLVRYATGEAERLGMNAEAASPGQDQAKLFVGSLPRAIREDEVRALFAPYGQVLEIFVMKDPQTGQGKGCAFVKFAYKEQAINAIRLTHGQITVPGAPRPLEVRFAESKSALVQQQVQQQVAALAASGAFGANQDLGTVLNAAAASGVLGGLAAAAAAQQSGGAAMGGSAHAAGLSPVGSNLNPRCAGAWKEYFTDDGRAYYHNETTGLTQWEKPAEFDKADITGPLGANIFIFHVPNEWSQPDLIQAFGPFGQILSARVVTDKVTGRNKGYAFVSYASVASAAQAVQHMNGYMAGQKRLKVSIKQGEEQYAQMYLGQPGAAAPGALPQVPGFAALTAGAQASTPTAAATTQGLLAAAAAFGTAGPTGSTTPQSAVHRFAPY